MIGKKARLRPGFFFCYAARRYTIAVNAAATITHANWYQ